jgi:peptidoglycan/xylan/chitin deacetylase (PgdA/CDA1 family)
VRSPAVRRLTGGLVLCYHAISDEWADPLAVSPGSFRRQISALLHRGFRGAPLDEVVEGRGRLLHVTFDDAFRNIEVGLRELERLRVPATIFACSGLADEGRRLDVPEVRMRSRMQPQATETMDWTTLRAIRSRGFGIGSHTINHAHLARLSDAELELELVGSRNRIEEMLQEPCRFLAYPYGESDDRVRRAAEAAGYTAAFSLRRAGVEDQFGLPRLDIYRGDGRIRFRLKTSVARGAALRLRNLLPGSTTTRMAG